MRSNESAGRLQYELKIEIDDGERQQHGKFEYSYALMKT
jgi:hypothetical protein